MAMLLWQDITGQTSEIVSELADTSLPSLMAMAFVFAMMALPLYATYLIIRTIRTKPDDKKPDDNDTNSGLVSAIGTMAETFSSSMKEISVTMKQISATAGLISDNQNSEHKKITESLSKLQEEIVKHNFGANKTRDKLDTISKTIQELSNTAKQFSQSSDEKHGNLTQKIDEQKESVEAMNDKIDSIERTIERFTNEAMDAIKEAAKNACLSDETQTQMVALLAQELEPIIERCAIKAFQKVTQETTIIENDNPNTEETKTDV